MTKILNLFKSSKSRNAVMLLAIIVVVVGFFSVYMFRQNKIPASGRAKIAKAPAQIEYEPGAQKVSKEYLKTLLQSEKIASERALRTGSSTVPPLIASTSGADVLGQGFQDQASSDAFCKKVKQCVAQEPARQGLEPPKKEQVGVVSATTSEQQALSAAKPKPQATTSFMKQAQQEGKISVATAKALQALSDENLSAGEYAAKLNDLVSKGQLDPVIAKQLLAKYRAEHGDTSVDATGIPASFARQQRQQQEQELQQQSAKLQQKAEAMQVQKDAARVAKTQQAIQLMEGEMSSQARQMISSWNAVPQRLILGSVKKKTTTKEQSAEISKKKDQAGHSDRGTSKAPLVKVGTIMFAVLETAVNTDRPGPVMATIVSGKLKGAKLLGGLTQTPDGERVVLKFTLLNMPQWSSAATIQAYAINPDTARTAVASDVDHHYLSRYGALFAANFVKGYADAVSQSGQTNVTNSGTTTTTNPNLSSREKILVGLGEVGKQVSSSVKKYFNRKPTVTVDAGVGIGILFMEPVIQPS